MRSDSDHLDPRQRVPAYYRESPETAAILDTLAEATGLCGEALEDLKRQFFPSTATWSLPLWEQKLGIPTDVGRSDEARRAEIRRKLVARGPVTAATVEELARAYTGYDAVVIVHPEDYSFELEFHGEPVGFVSMDLSDLLDTILVLKPAHMDFYFSRLNWGELEAMQLTWEQLEAKQLTWGRLETMVPIRARNEVRNA